jgi:hypothetical protein
MNPNINYDELDKLEQIQESAEEDDIEIQNIPNDMNFSQSNNEQRNTVTAPGFETIQLRNLIFRYKDKFGKYLGNFEERIDKVNSMSRGELETLLQEIKVAVGSRGSSNMFITAFITGAGVLENIAPAINMDLEGLQRQIGLSADFKELLEEVALDCQFIGYVEPWKRLLYNSGQLILALNQSNKNLKKKNLINNAVVPESVRNEFADL